MIAAKSVRQINTVALARAAGIGRSLKTYTIPNIPRPTLLSQQLSGCACASGLGFVDLSTGTNEGNTSILGAVALGTNFIPVVGPLASSTVAILGSAIGAFQNWLGIGKGRAEADIIVPYQNTLLSRLDGITDQILLGRNPSLSQLQSLYREVWQLAVGFAEYVALRDFTDRRASGQALNTIMPYIDGTCGYAVPLPLRIPSPMQQGCLTWGDWTLGGPGTNGMLGAMARAIVAAGGDVPELAAIVQSANDGFKVSSTGTLYPGEPSSDWMTAGPSTLLPVAIGVGALFLFAGKRRFF